MDRRKVSMKKKDYRMSEERGESIKTKEGDKLRFRFSVTVISLS